MLLSPETIRILLAKLPLKDGTFFVGGQALIFWAERYSDFPGLQAYGPYASKDMDVFGGFDAAKHYAKAIGGEVKARDPNNPIQFVEAVVEAVVNGQKVKTDFLNFLIGTTPESLKKNVVDLLVPGGKDGDDVLVVPVMHPLHILQSRISNVETLEPSFLQSEPAGREVRPRRRQADAAPLVLHAYILEMLDLQQTREAQGTLTNLGHWLTHEGMYAHRSTDNDPRDILVSFLDDERLDARWRQNNLASIVANVERKRRSFKPTSIAKGPSRPDDATATFTRNKRDFGR